MGDKATLRMARQELEDLYLVGVPDDSVDLTFRDLASSSLPAAATTTSNLPPIAAEVDDDAGDERKRNNKTGLARSSTNIFTYRPIEDREEDLNATTLGRGGGGVLLQLPSPPPPPRRHHDNNHGPAAMATTTGGTNNARAASDRRPRRSNNNNNNVANGHHMSSNYKQRPGIPHSNICALCDKYVYIFRHRCLVCGRVYCRRCVGAGMADMTEGRKCIDCLGRRYSHRYIHRAGDTAGGCCLCLFWGYYPSAKAAAAQELVWAEKGPAPRRRRPAAAGSSSYAAGDYYSSTNTVASASMSMTINSDNSVAGNSIGGMPASASSSFVASYAPNPHAFPL